MSVLRPIDQAMKMALSISGIANLKKCKIGIEDKFTSLRTAVRTNLKNSMNPGITNYKIMMRNVKDS